MKMNIKQISWRIKRKFQHLIDRRILRSNAKYKNQYAGKRCFILGSGPSIKDQDLTKLRDEWTFAMNTFCMHKQYDQIHPKFYVIFHSEYLRGDKTSIEFLNTLSSKIHEDTILVLPLKTKRLFESLNVLPKNKKIYIYVRGFMEKEKPDGFNITRAVPSPMSVSVMCLIVALYMGFDPIYLMGLEHNWLAIPPKMDFPHFSDSYSGQFLHRDSSETYEQNCWTSYLLFRNYRLLSKSTKSKIINLTPTSYLDTFPFDKYENIISQK